MYMNIYTMGQRYKKNAKNQRVEDSLRVNLESLMNLGSLAHTHSVNLISPKIPQYLYAKYLIKKSLISKYGVAEVEG